jgi:hypothetical protein
VFYRIEGSDAQSGKVVCRVTEASDESAAQQWAVDVAHIRVARIVGVSKPVWMRGGDEVVAPTEPAVAAAEESPEAAVAPDENSQSSADIAIETSEPEMISPPQRVWSSTLNERWEGESAPSPSLATGPLLPPPPVRPNVNQLPPPISAGLLAAMKLKLAAPREPLTPVQLTLLGLITLDFCAVVGLMLRGSFGAEPVSGVVQLYTIATIVNLPALLAIVIGYIYSKRTAGRHTARQMGIAFFVLLAGVFVVTVSIATGQLTTRETLDAQSRIRNSHRPSIARERAALSARSQ